MKSILVVEDEPTLQEIFSRAIEKAGYEVIVVSDGPSAVREIQSQRSLDLIVSDVWLDGSLQGNDLARLATYIRPNIKVLLVTGNPNLVLQDPSSDALDCEVMCKPFGTKELLQRVSQLAGASVDQ